MSTNDIIIGLVIAFFMSFAIPLFCISIYVRLGDSKPAKATTQPAQPAMRAEATGAANEHRPAALQESQME